VHFGEGWCEGSDGEVLDEGGLVERPELVAEGTVVGEGSCEIEMLSLEGVTTVMGSRGGRAILAD
jgi:hypothetical protein